LKKLCAMTILARIPAARACGMRQIVVEGIQKWIRAVKMCHYSQRRI
jgi:hypothetical protein